MAAGAEAIIADPLEAFAPEGHDLDGLSPLVVAAGDGLAVAVAGLVLGVVHPAEAGPHSLCGGLDSLFLILALFLFNAPILDIKKRKEVSQ